MKAVKAPELYVMGYTNIKSNEQKLDDMDQYSFRTTIILHGCRANEFADNDYGQMETAIAKKLSNALSCRVKPSDIDNLYGLSEKKGKRPILISFIRKSKKDEIFSKKKMLKSTGLSITESLTKRRLHLLEKAKNAFGFTVTWTMNGIVYAFYNNKRQVIYNEKDIENILKKVSK